MCINKYKGLGQILLIAINPTASPLFVWDSVNLRTAKIARLDML